MVKPIESLRREAVKKFMGRRTIVGVGITGNEAQPELVFLLSKESTEAKDSVLGWASQHCVRVQFVVTGKIKTLDGK